MTIVSLANYHGFHVTHRFPANVAPSPRAAGLAGPARETAPERGGCAASPRPSSGLASIERHGPITAGGLARHEHIRKPTATRLIASLVERGLVERLPDPLDRRVTWLRLTKEGCRSLQGFRRRKDRFLAERLGRLDPSDREVLTRAVEILDRLAEDPP
ncbi:MAG: MarR family transcriptional regulator [Actinomycetota bacterium]